ncbi:MAG: hypothetical protein ACYCSN_09305 [Acidobacteriaceae bacterium]
MKMDAEEVQQAMLERFKEAGLLPLVVRESSQVMDLGGEIFAEVVLTDRTRLDEASNLMRLVLKSAGRDEKNSSLVVRSKWSIADIGDPTPAYGQNGQVRAAVLIPVTLRSGDEDASVTVAVTTLAEMEFNRILGRKADLGQVARIVVESALRRSGSSFWDPITENYLEVASGAAANLSRMLKRTA